MKTDERLNAYNEIKFGGCDVGPVGKLVIFLNSVGTFMNLADGHCAP